MTRTIGSLAAREQEPPITLSDNAMPDTVPKMSAVLKWKLLAILVKHQHQGIAAKKAGELLCQELKKSAQRQALGPSKQDVIASFMPPPNEPLAQALQQINRQHLKNELAAITVRIQDVITEQIRTLPPGQWQEYQDAYIKAHNAWMFAKQCKGALVAFLAWLQYIWASRCIPEIVKEYGAYGELKNGIVYVKFLEGSKGGNLESTIQT